MRRAITFTVAATAGLALALSAATGPTTAAAPTGEPSAASAKGPSKWTKISTGSVYSTNEAALYRTGDGTLHVAYARGSASQSLAWSNVSKHGRLVGQGTITSGWDSYSSNPKLIPTPNNGLRLVFGGIDADGPDPYNDGGLYSATASNAGRQWTLTPGRLLDTAPIATYGIGAVPMGDQAPIVADSWNGITYWRQADGSSTPTTPDNQVSNGDCCAYHTDLARDNDGRVFLGWNSGGGSDSPGIFVKRLLPAAGPKIKAPGSANPVDIGQTVALTGRRDAPGVYAAYCSGHSSCKSIKLWRVGAKKAITVPRSRNAENIAIAAAPAGRLWVVWNNDVTERVHATLTNKKATRFGVVRTVKAPTRDTYKLSAYSGAVRHLDVVVNTGSAFLHRQLLPGLKLTAKPQRFDNDRKRVVTFKVTDAGAPVAGAKVRIAGKADVTNAKGQARIAFRKGFRPGRYHGTAAEPGYAKGHVTVRVFQ